MNKYRAVKSGGYHSKREHRRADELRMMEKLGLISELREQVKYELIPKCGEERTCSWIADFVYRENGEEVVEDCKGYRTDVYKIKKKIFQYRYGIKIRET